MKKTIRFIQFLLIYQTYVGASSVDLSKFGANCLLHLKRFKDTETTMDWTELLILEQKLNVETGLGNLITVFGENATKFGHQIQPAIAFHEDCSLNVIINPWAMLNHNDLSNYVRKSNYTFSSKPYSTYIIVVSSGHFMLPDGYLSQFVSFPTRFFHLFIRNPEKELELVFFCNFCEWDSRYVWLRNDRTLATFSQMDLSRYWRTFILVQIVGVLSNDWTDCEAMFWDIKRNDARSYACRNLGAALSVIFHAVNVNFTIQTHTASNNFYTHGFYSGHIFKNSYYEPEPFKGNYISSISFVEVSVGVVHYCDCGLGSYEELNFMAWVNPFQLKIWLSFIVLLFLISLVDRIQQDKSWKETLKDILSNIFNVLCVTFRQAPKNTTVLIIMLSFVVFICSNCYENFVTSELVAPSPKRLKSLSGIIDDGYSIIYDQLEMNKLHRKLISTALHRLDIKEPEKYLRSTHSLEPLLPYNGSKFGIFTILGPENAKGFNDNLQTVYYPPYCKCFMLEHKFVTHHAYHFFFHNLRWSFQRKYSFLVQSGIYNFLYHTFNGYSNKVERSQRKVQWDEERFGKKGGKDIMNGLINLKSLASLFVLTGALVIVELVCFFCENYGRIGFRMMFWSIKRIFKLELKIVLRCALIFVRILCHFIADVQSQLRRNRIRAI
jgi:hypothetical protein